MHHLHPSILDVVAAAGYDAADAESVHRLQAHYARRGASGQDLAILARRLSRRSDLEHARREGRHRRPSAAVIELDRIVLRALAPHLHDLPAWGSWHHDGDSVQVIASRAGADPTVVRLALEGLPGRPGDPVLVESLTRAGRLWRSGAPASTVAVEGFGRSPAWLRQARRTGRVGLYPQRLLPRDIATLAGVNAGRVSTWASAGLLPTPDGIDLRPWWWEPTITAWIDDALPHRCHHCSARLPTLTGMRVHATKQHTPPV